MKIKKGDKIMIIKGKDRGKSGKVALVDPNEGTVVVHGLNQVKKSVRPKKQDEQGQIISVPRPIRISNVMLVCPSCGKASRFGSIIEKGKKKRVCKKCSAAI
ncbi:MAG: 50S ribosomal protein L24 [Candidatus Colwellbacteria bacterium]|nr:50S ribosomal protein L24 [Candidatus Colwellbacteria bacterium]MDD4818781.1 50S ribosomal protein L24 [Candidatus Colwellbacteria bacterium]